MLTSVLAFLGLSRAIPPLEPPASWRARGALPIPAIGLVALLVFPLAIGLGAIAPTLVKLTLDPRWWVVAPMLMILSALSVLRPLGRLVGSYLQAMRRPHVAMALEILKTAAIVAFVWLLGRLGPLWACAGIGLAFGAHAAAAIWSVHRDDGLPFGALVKPLVAPLVCCAPLALSVVLTRAAFAAPSWLGLAAELVVGATVYVSAAFLVAPQHARELLALLASATRTRFNVAPQP